MATGAAASVLEGSRLTAWLSSPSVSYSPAPPPTSQLGGPCLHVLGQGAPGSAVFSSEKPRSRSEDSRSQVSPLPPSSSSQTTATSCSSGHRGVLASGWAPLGASPVCPSSEESARVAVWLSCPLPARSVCTCLPVPCALLTALQTFRDTVALPATARGGCAQGPRRLAPGPVRASEPWVWPHSLGLCPALTDGIGLLGAELLGRPPVQLWDPVWVARPPEGSSGPDGRQVPDLSHLAERLIHLQEKLPRDTLQSQEVLSKHRLS